LVVCIRQQELSRELFNKILNTKPFIVFSILAISIVFAFGLMESPGIFQYFETLANQNTFDLQMADASPSGLVASSNPNGTITLTWTADPSATSYRIFRTSTETVDEVIEYSFAGTLNPQATTLSEQPKDFGVETFWIDARFRDEIVSRVTASKIGSFGSGASGGFLQAVIMEDAVSLGGNSNIIVNSTTKIDPATIPVLACCFNGVSKTFIFLGTDLVNLTTTNMPSSTNVGVGLAWFDGTSGSILFNSRDGTSAGIQRRWDASVPQWASTNGQDFLMTVASINQTKLSNNPFVFDTTSISTTFLDTTTIENNTYFYRVTTLVSGVADGKSNVDNATSTTSPSPTLKITKLTTGGDDTFNFTVAGPTSYNPSINTAGGGTIATNEGTLGSSANAFYFEDDVLTIFNQSNGIIGESVYQKGLATEGIFGDIRFGDDADKSQWEFLQKGLTGNDVTSINLWVNGDLVGSPRYPILTTFNTQASIPDYFEWITSDDDETYFRVVEDSDFTIINTGFSGVPADDGQWHMMTLIYGKNGEDVLHYIDGNPTTSTFQSNGAFTGTGGSINATLTLGGHNADQAVTENGYFVDDVAIWNGYNLTATDIANLYNSGVGTRADTITAGSSSLVLYHTFDDFIGGGNGMGMDGPTTVNPGTYNVTEIIPSGWNLTSATCNDGSSSFSVDTVSGIVIGAGDNVECTFEDTFTPPVQTCNGLPATIVGTAGDDFLTGTSGDDVIVGLEGDDVILGNGGNDTICAGAGQDYVTGNAGADTIFGEGGKDHLNGRGGSDTIDGGPGDDFIAGRNGNDILMGGGGDDHISGENGNDTIEGNGGVDHISGGDGNDNIRGNGGDDVISGGNGDDDLDGDAGFDYCIDTVGSNTFTQCEITS
jgi:Ca2+-binding RTX toxin-like protein